MQACAFCYSAGMTLRLHHCFILASPGAPEAEQLAAIGLAEGPANTHPGQGTANRRFFFADHTLELLFLRDQAEAREGPARRLRLAQRHADAQASPFGLVFESTDKDNTPPISGWPYRAEYLPSHQHFLVGHNSEQLAEPLCICMPSGLKSPALAPAAVNSEYELGEIRISLPTISGSATLTQLASCDRLSLQFGQPQLLEIRLHHRQQDWQHDLRPRLPLILRCQREVRGGNDPDCPARRIQDSG